MTYWCALADVVQEIADADLDPVRFGIECEAAMGTIYYGFQTSLGWNAYEDDQCPDCDNLIFPNGACCYFNPASCFPPCFNDPEGRQMCRQPGGVWNTATCTCDPASSPVLLDIAGNGFSLTDSDNGVEFDFDGDGWLERTSWTSGDSDDAFLVLDRNGNGQIENGGELFGDQTNQPSCGERQGFHALASFDESGLGGNQDGAVSPTDEVFSRLRLWTDSNHDGVSQAAELKTLTESGVAWIDLNIKESRHHDRYGNRFRYRCKVQTSNGRRFAYDVFLNLSTR